MKKHFLILTVVFGLTIEQSMSQTSIPGGAVSGNWTLAGSPYLIQGAIMIANGSTLTIDPGVKVEFQGFYKFLVLGRLLAIGNPTDTITFTAADTAIGWLGIRFDSTASTNDTSKIYYCKLQYGKATGSWNSPDNNGGAFYFNYFSKAIISNSHIIYCSANANGGGIYCSNSSPTIINNIISNNTASPTSGTLGGGGIYCYDSSPIISGNLISYNSTNNSGGGIYCYNCNSIIANNNISNNTVSHFGGGIDCYGSNSNPTITNNTISYNAATDAGGGVYCIYGSPTISNNIISNNTASPSFSTILGGGGICCYPNSSPVISNNVISNNYASNGGAISCIDNNNPNISNNSISNNSAQRGGALFCSSSSNPTLLNNIIWGNIATTMGNQVFLDDEASDPNINYCNIQGGQSAITVNTNVFYLGTYANNIDSVPLYVSPSGGVGTGFNGITADWSLQSTSPCINTGDTTGAYPATDITGNPRVVGNRIDIGAYEYQSVLEVSDYYNVENQTTVYPNPFSTQTTLRTIIPLSHASLTIYNSFGQTVKQIKNISGQTIILHRDNLPSGLYFIRLTEYNKIIATTKLLITD